MADYKYVWSTEKEGKVSWRYTNHVFPMSLLFMRTGDDIRLLLRTFVGNQWTFDPDTCEATTGSSGIGWWEEGDIEFFDENGRMCTLSYDFMPIDDTWEKGRIFRYVTFEN